jgi:hypothetical protein
MFMLRFILTKLAHTVQEDRLSLAQNAVVSEHAAEDNEASRIRYFPYPLAAFAIQDDVRFPPAKMRTKNIAIVRNLMNKPNLYELQQSSIERDAVHFNIVKKKLSQNLTLGLGFPALQKVIQYDLPHAGLLQTEFTQQLVDAVFASLLPCQSRN